MKVILTTQDHAHSQEKFNIISTEQEGVYQTDPVKDNLKDYYNFKDYHSHQTKHSDIISKLYHHAKKINFSYKRRLIKKYIKNGVLLEYGAGNGGFSNFIKKDYDVIAFEPYYNNKAQPLDNYINSLDQVKNNSIDIICLWHVIEHIKDINIKISAFYKVLKQNGIIIIAVPNYDSLDAKYYKNFWAAWDVPRHIWHFNQNGMINTMKDFELITIKPLWFDAFYVSILSERYKKSSLAIIKGLIIGFISNVYAIFTKNHSSLIYILKKSK